MKLKLADVVALNNALAALVDQKINDVKLAYKLYKLKREVETVLEPLFKLAQKDKDNPEIETLLDEDEALDFTPLPVDELGAFDLSIKDIANLAPILKEEEEE